MAGKKAAEAAPAGGTDVPSANTLYTMAQSRLREAHRDEFIKILEGVYTENNLTYKHKRTKEEREAALAEAKRQKAADAMRAMVQEWGPSLVTEVTDSLADADEVDPAQA